MLKKLLSVLLLIFFVSFFTYAETYMLPTSQGDKELYIPDDHEELREAFIEMSSLYIEERFDHEKSLSQIDSLLKLHDDYKEYYTNLEKTTQKLIKELSKDDTDLFRVYLQGHYRYDLLNPFFNVGIGIQIQIFESITFGLFYEVPSSVGVNVSGRIY